MKTNILECIEKNMKISEINFQDDSWRKLVPSKPGWYFFETNTPLGVLKKVGNPVGRAHYNIPQKIKAALMLNQINFCILPFTESSFYFVYSGEAKNLKNRAREHIRGDDKTGCLALKNYPQLHKYIWRFHFSECPYGKEPNESKVVRVFGEQLWRAKHGWPILCAE